MTTRAELLAAWEAWDARPGEAGDAGRMEDACQTYPHPGLSTTEFRHRLSELRRVHNLSREEALTRLENP